MGYGLLPPIPLALNPALYRLRSDSELKTKLPCLSTVCLGKPNIMLEFFLTIAMI